MDINKVILLGRLTREPDIKTDMDKGYKVANFSIATNRFYKKDGEKQSEVEYHNIVAWNKLAVVVEDYCEKGSLVYIEGRKKTEKYSDEYGHENRNVKIIANVIQVLNKNQK